MEEVEPLESAVWTTALFSMQAAPKGCRGNTWQQQDGCICASLVLSSHRAKCKRYFRPDELLIKHLKTFTGMVQGVKE